MLDQLLSDLDQVDFPAETGITQSQTIPWLLSALADKADTPQDAERIDKSLREELMSEHYADGPARPLKAWPLKVWPRPGRLSMVCSVSRT